MDVLSKQKFTNLLIVILVIMNVASLTFIWYKQLQGPPPPPPPKPGQEHVNNFLGKELDLTPEQQKQFADIRKEHSERTRATNEEIGRLRRQIMEESFREKIDTNRINQLADQIAEVQKSYEKFLSQHFQKLSEVCNPEQKKMLREIFMSSFGPGERPPEAPGRRPERRQPPPRRPR